jgi:hypothetical protein
MALLHVLGRYPSGAAERAAAADYPAQATRAREMLRTRPRTGARASHA